MGLIVASMRRLALWLLRAALGGAVERRVLPVAAVSFVYSASFSTFWVYVGVFAVKGSAGGRARSGSCSFSAPRRPLLPTT
jgi:hypothetical protein